MSDDVIASRPLAYAPTGRKLEPHAPPAQATWSSPSAVSRPPTSSGSSVLAELHRSRRERFRFQRRSRHRPRDGRGVRRREVRSAAERRPGAGRHRRFLIRDGWLVYLRRRGDAGAKRTTVLGEIGGREVAPLMQPTDRRRSTEGEERMSCQRKFLNLSDWRAVAAAGLDAGILSTGSGHGSGGRAPATCSTPVGGIGSDDSTWIACSRSTGSSSARPGELSAWAIGP